MSGFIRKLFLGLMLCSGLFAESERGMGVKPTATAVGDALDYHLLVIGIDDYLDWPDLKSAVRDAEAVASVLQSNYGFEPERTTTLFNAEATERNILATLRNYAKELEADDALLIYYAGHGQLDSVLGDGAWVPVDGERSSDSRWISNARIKRYLGRTKARHILLISDSCFAGDFFRGTRGAPPEITNAYVRSAFGKNARQAMTSGGVEPVADAGFEGHSVFAYFLLKALRENESPYLVPSDLYQRIKGGVAANAKQQPILGLLSGTGGEVGGEFVLFRKGVGGSLDDLIERKRQSLSLLEEQEAAVAAANAEQARLAAEKQKELDALDARIATMQTKLNTGDSSGGSLSELVALIDQKEKQAVELAALEKKRREEAAAREAEIRRLKAEEAAKRKAAFEQDYEDYQRILTSSHATADIKQKAWEALLQAWEVPLREILTKNKMTLIWRDGKVLPDPKDLNQLPPITDPMTGKRTKTIILPSGVEMEFVWIGPGSFTMGMPVAKYEEHLISIQNSDKKSSMKAHNIRILNNLRPHRVFITRGFWIGKTEVTQRQWTSIMEKNPSMWQTGSLLKKRFLSKELIESSDNYPVEGVSWYNAKVFIDKLNELVEVEFNDHNAGKFSLPTEAQWEFAAKDKYNSESSLGFSSSNCMGNVELLRSQAWYNRDAKIMVSAGEWSVRTFPVASKLPNEYGLYDMLGNVQEHCIDSASYLSDWEYPEMFVFDPVNFVEEKFRILRGGSVETFMKISVFNRDISLPEDSGGHDPRTNRREFYGLRLVINED